MSIMAILRTMLERGRDALPGAWQHDPVFRAAAISLGVTAVLLLARLIGPQLPDLQPHPYDSPAAAPFPGRDRGAALPAPSAPQVAAPPEVLKIPPGQSLNDVTVAPAAENDRFGTFKPGPRP